jgi:branched-chain amino acid transport system substrate-binding protein
MIRRRLLALLPLLAAARAGAAPGAARGAPVLVGLDAEFGIATSTSAQAVQQGVQVAMDEVNERGGVLGGRPLALVTTDNSAIAAKARDNLRTLAANPDLVAVFGGKYSPIYMECLPLAQELGILLLDPWGSADPITDNAVRGSYAFRLSLKDSWAGAAFVRFAREHHGASTIGLLLPNTAWGRSSRDAILTHAAKSRVVVAAQEWFNWGERTLSPQYRRLRLAGAQAIVVITNEVEGAMLAREVAALPKPERLPIISHWGVTGGRFAQLAGASLDAIDYTVIQTFRFVGNESPAARRLVAALQRKYGVAGAADVKSPAGVAHAYDLMHLLVRAIAQAGSTDRARVRSAMEQLGPYDGVVRRYERPFTAQRHDALTPAQIFFARYLPGDRLAPVAPPSARRQRV